MILLVAYLTIVALVLLTIKWDNYPKENPHAIVILSGSNKYITRFRLLWAIYLIKKHNYKGKVYVCGKKLCVYMKDYILSRVHEVGIVTVNSSNTLEDAQFTHRVIQDNSSVIILITSLSHQLRAYNTFKKVFGASKIINCPTWYDLGSWFSPLLPTGWVAVTINIIKNFKYSYLSR